MDVRQKYIKVQDKNFTARFVYKRLISAGLIQKVCNSKINIEVEELTNPKYIEIGKKILCLGLEIP